MRPLQKLINHIARLFLSFALVLIGVSPEFLHDHEDNFCHEQHSAGEVDTCHLSIHHKSKAHQCDDHDHLVTFEPECAFCLLMSGGHWLFAAPDFEKTVHASPASAFSALAGHATVDGLFLQPFVRGPPDLA